VTYPPDPPLILPPPPRDTDRRVARYWRGRCFSCQSEALRTQQACCSLPVKFFLFPDSLSYVPSSHVNSFFPFSPCFVLYFGNYSLLIQFFLSFSFIYSFIYSFYLSFHHLFLYSLFMCFLRPSLTFICTLTYSTFIFLALFISTLRKNFSLCLTN
jgi:hypothetical protein